jgi:uridine kinase
MTDKGQTAENIMFSEIMEVYKRKGSAAAAIDGRSAAGKTTLAAALSKRLGCTLIHMDDFFLSPGQRTPERLAEPGGNVDRERFRQEVLEPLSRGEDFEYGVFDCTAMSVTRTVKVRYTPVTIIEGAYSCHPELWPYYDLHFFISVSKEEQRKRILNRNGPEKAEQFMTRWIPMEEKYFAAFDTETGCRLIYN